MSEEGHAGSVGPAVFIVAGFLGTVLAAALWAAGASGLIIALAYFGSPAILILYGRVFARGGSALGRMAGTMRRRDPAPAHAVDPAGSALAPAPVPGPREG